MGDKFFDAQHVRQKLNNTVCMYKGQPYYIVHEGIGEEVLAYSMDIDPRRDSAKKPLSVSYTDKEFDYSEINLGYMNMDGTAYYVARDPRRINSQGLTSGALRITPALSMRDVGMMRREFYDCIMGRHPSLKEALDKLSSGEADSVAIARHFAIGKVSNKVYGVYHRSRLIALSTNRGQSFTPSTEEATHLIIKRLRNLGISVV